jgi:hypothetical protein
MKIRSICAALKRTEAVMARRSVRFSVSVMKTP